MINGINHITIAVKDLEMSFSFYRDVMKFRPLMRHSKGAYFLAGESWFCLDLDPQTRLSALPEYTHFAFGVSQENFSAVRERIIQSGAKPWKDNKSEGDSFYFLDPDGHKLEVHVGDWRSRLQAAKEKPWNDSLVFFNLPPMLDLIFVQPELKSARLLLEPITESHAAELREFFSDDELHTFVPYKQLTPEAQRERCARWAKRKSPDGKELWLNWFARDASTKLPVGHFQSGLKEDGIASIGYVVARKFQGKGYATEALQTIFEYLQNHLKATEVKAWSDTRNLASHRVATKMGMSQVELIKDADFFRGATSDEFVFSKIFRDKA